VHSGIYAAYSGLKAQMDALDTLANNLANVNTAGFKEQKSCFPALNLALDSPDTTPFDSVVNTSVSAESALNLSDGSLVETHRDLDLALAGNGQLAYTRNGNFHMNRDGSLVTSDGDLLDPPIAIPQDQVGIMIGSEGTVSVVQANQTQPQQIGKIELALFQNPAGLESIGNNLCTPTQASGDAITGTPGENGLGTLLSGFIEQSNVSVVGEMVNMIVSQRAYEANSKVIRTADEMCSQANNVVR